MNKEYVVVRTVSGRRKFYCGQRLGKPVYATAAVIRSGRFGGPYCAQAYTRKDNAKRAANRLEDIENNRFWSDRRVSFAFVDVVEADSVNVVACTRK